MGNNQPVLMTNSYATRIHFVGATQDTSRRVVSLCGSASGMTLTADAIYRRSHRWPSKSYAATPVCSLCQREWAKLDGEAPDLSALLATLPSGPSKPARKVGARPWRIERVTRSGEWRALTTTVTKESAEQQLAWYRHHEYGTLRIKNRDTGEVIE